MSSARTAAGPGRIDASLLAVALVWGSTYLTAKELVVPSTVVAILALRFALTVVAMLPFCLGRLRRTSRDELRTGVLLGVILAAEFALETFGIAGTSATNAGLIISLTLVLTALLESSLSRSWLPPRFYVAAVLSVVGVALLATGSSVGAPTWGDLLILLAAAVRAVHVTAMHRLSAGRRHDAFTLTFVQLSVCAVVFCALTPWVGESMVAVAPQLDVGQWVRLAYLALICTVFAFVVQMWAVRLTSPSRVSLLLGTEPIWALAIGVVIAGDRIGWMGLLGAAAIVVGTAWGRRIERLHREHQGSAAVVLQESGAVVTAAR
ncbi:DMT family transporter [Pengzhenrongella frigida]|uniref:DMT family transporter n=1 Tax=Pengzhenrongella frigida TaxID=1259133 RepID=A0A4V1ZH63_9MICO|nr:DMT family transporter [Cellulomonas sp. HLT2-17]RYV50944.1 DMT family transporter [Cellulomonas sp. HLT2-17]